MVRSLRGLLHTGRGERASPAIQSPHSPHCSDGKRKNASITAQEVHDRAGAVLQRCLRFKDYSAKCSAALLISVILYATARAMTLSRAARRLGNVPSHETLRKALLHVLPSARELERRINHGLALDLPKGFRRRDYPVVIDLHDSPYYGAAR